MNANCDTPQNSDSRSHTENRILKAAEAEFLAKGYAGARTTAIAEAAGVTHAMLHYYFRTRISFSSASSTKKYSWCATSCFSG